MTLDPLIAAALPVADAADLRPFAAVPNIDLEIRMSILAERLGLSEELHAARQDPTGAALLSVLETMKARTE